MEDKFDELKDRWNEAKKGQASKGDSATMLSTVIDNHSKSKRAHLGNILVLCLVVVGLAAFFYYVAPMQDTLSRVGIGLMIGGLIVRIIIEAISHRKATQIDYSSSSKNSAALASSFYNYRKQIHGPVTITIIVLYTIGFYALTPEFSKYFDTFWMWMIDGSYVVIAIVLFIVIRKGVIDEMQNLRKIRELEQTMHGD
ncbi:MAG: hypothetical protein RJQ14_12435 [Marinoscillum sp.]